MDIVYQDIIQMILRGCKLFVCMIISFKILIKRFINSSILLIEIGGDSTFKTEL